MIATSIGRAHKDDKTSETLFKIGSLERKISQKWQPLKTGDFQHMQSDEVSFHIKYHFSIQPHIMFKLAYFCLSKQTVNEAYLARILEKAPLSKKKSV